MDEKESIENLLSHELGDMAWHFEGILNRYPLLKENEQYKRIVEAVHTIEDATHKLSEQIK
ncbi:hypothetical protein ACQKMD_16585 [Viridibacillus sp. NPDC096237]|uniref:hypothetical protein n=1 Tax=Viridibacillus sp. NPDC096237 TaxID=3390721 RepID=UPI003CFFD2F9